MIDKNLLFLHKKTDNQFAMDENKDNIQSNSLEENHIEPSNSLQKVIHIQDQFKEWFLDYASSANPRAIPDITDGLKPVQRRILHSMDELEDGRYNKVANIIGNTMKYHPHGDASIGDALVNMGQKDLLIDCQGNWGNVLTGDGAAAPRYIEARLTKFAIEVCFNPKTTQWKLSYDSRNKEPIALPIKFPLLLAQGTDGLGIGLSTSILPHNFNELIDASIAILQNKDFVIYPDIPTGGYIDISGYNHGKRGGKVKMRAKIEPIDKKNLLITELPYGVTTQDLIQSIEKAVDNKKISLKKINDNTSDKAEIMLQLGADASTDQTIDALYAFTLCQQSYSPNACVFENKKPIFVDVKYILQANTQRTLDLLEQELKFELDELSAEWHWVSLEKIFFEKRIYKELEKDTDNFEQQIEAIERAFDPYRPMFKQEITTDDVLKLTEKPVRKISKFDIKKAEDKIAEIEANIDEIQNHLAHLVDYTINYFKQIKKKYGQGRDRKTEIRNFDTISVEKVAIANQKLYVDKENGFVGIGLKKNEAEYVCDCSDIDEVIVFREDGTFKVSKIADKQFFGNGIIHVAIFSRNDTRTIYNVIYSDGKNGIAFAKRFAVGGITRDKDYDITQGKQGSKILHFTANNNGEAEVVKVTLKPKPKLKKINFTFDFSTLAIKGRAARGNIVSKNPIKNIHLIKKGTSTLGDLAVWFDDSINRLNVEERGYKLGNFSALDKIIAYYQSAYYKITGFDTSTHFDDNLLKVEKLKTQKPITIVYLDKEKNKYFIKRILPEITDKKVEMLQDMQIVQLMTFDYRPQIEVHFYGKDKTDKQTEIIDVEAFVEIGKTKYKGKRIPIEHITSFQLLEPLPYEETIEETPEDEYTESIEDTDEPEVQISFDEDDDRFSGAGEQMSLFGDDEES